MRVFLDVEIRPDGIGDWAAAYARAQQFVAAKGAMYGAVGGLEDLDSDMRALLAEVYASDPEWSNRGLARFDVRPPDVHAGRMVIELFADLVPKTAENFRCLCSGEKGTGKASKKLLHYRGSKFHRIKRGFMVQGGDFVRGDGTGGDSIYGGKFNDEKAGLKLKHDKRGILSMANSGKNSNSSQFFITFGHCKSLDGKHVVFGQVVEGLEVLDKLEAIAPENGDDGEPLAEAVISNSGDISS
eukprot:gene9476-1718_t